MSTIDIVFDGPPGPTGGHFVEVENAEGSSIQHGEWVERPDGYWALRIPEGKPPKVGTDWDSVAQAQGHITRWANANFPHRTAHHALSKLVLEEIPEMLEEVRRMKAAEKEGVPFDKVKLEMEYADTLILLFDLASIWRLDIQRGLANKMQINEHRMWGIDENGIAHHVSVKHPEVVEQGRGR